MVIDGTSIFLLVLAFLHNDGLITLMYHKFRRIPHIVRPWFKNHISMVWELLAVLLVLLLQLMEKIQRYLQRQTLLAILTYLFKNPFHIWFIIQLAFQCK